MADAETLAKLAFQLGNRSRILQLSSRAANFGIRTIDTIKRPEGCPSYAGAIVDVAFGAQQAARFAFRAVPGLRGE